MKTAVLKGKQIKRVWQLIDLKNETLGRSASRIAQLLMGKHKPSFTPNLDGGDYVVVINSDHLKVTGKKMFDKIYYRHSGFPGNLKPETLAEKMAKDSRQVVIKAVKGMLPKNRHQTLRLRRLKVFAGGTHPYQRHFTNN